MKITLEESTTAELPPLLCGIISRVLKENKSIDSIQKDFMFALVVVSMLENGFLPSDNDLKVIDPSSSIDITKWKASSGVYQAIFVLAGFDSNLILTVTPMGSTVLVNLIITEFNSETYTVCLPISRYVVSPQASTIPMIFRDLKQLSINMKNKVLVPVKSRLLTYYGHPSASLLGLPDEVLYNLMQCLSIRNIINISRTCKRLKCLVDNQSFWHALYKRDFNNNTQVDGIDWKEMYKTKFISSGETELKQLQRVAGNIHDFMDYSDFVSYIDNPMWSVVI